MHSFYKKNTTHLTAFSFQQIFIKIRSIKNMNYSEMYDQRYNFVWD